MLICHEYLHRASSSEFGLPYFQTKYEQCGKANPSSTSIHHCTYSFRSWVFFVGLLQQWAYKSVDRFQNFRRYKGWYQSWFSTIVPIIDSRMLGSGGSGVATSTNSGMVRNPIIRCYMVTGCLIFAYIYVYIYTYDCLWHSHSIILL